jgi:hypothetical protein
MFLFLVYYEPDIEDVRGLKLVVVKLMAIKSD